MLPAVKRMFVNTRTSSIGWSLCCSHRTKPTSRGSGDGERTERLDRQPAEVRRLDHTPHEHTDAAIESTVPRGSKRVIVSSRDVGTMTAMAIIATAISGTLTRKTEPHRSARGGSHP